MRPAEAGTAAAAGGGAAGARAAAPGERWAGARTADASAKINPADNIKGFRRRR